MRREQETVEVCLDVPIKRIIAELTGEEIYTALVNSEEPEDTITEVAEEFIRCYSEDHSHSEVLESFSIESIVEHYKVSGELLGLLEEIVDASQDIDVLTVIRILVGGGDQLK